MRGRHSISSFVQHDRMTESAVSLGGSAMVHQAIKVNGAS